MKAPSARHLCRKNQTERFIQAPFRSGIFIQQNCRGSAIHRSRSFSGRFDHGLQDYTDDLIAQLGVGNAEFFPSV
jgi:hypothetical protein